MVPLNTQPQIAMKVRIVFSKQGRCKFISHLDVMRTITRIVLRANIPIAYTCGFNPIPKITFLAPLSLGIDSQCEMIDLPLTIEMDCTEVKNQLNRFMPEEMKILDAYEAKNSSNDISFASYDMRLFSKHNEDYLPMLQDYFKKSQMIVRKKTKSGEKDVDIFPIIEEYSFEKKDDNVTIHLMLKVLDNSFLNPDYYYRSFVANIPEFHLCEKDEYIAITRTGFYDKDKRIFR